MAIKAILDALNPSDSASGMHGRSEKETQADSGGKVLIYVWALEQRGSRRGWDEGCEQDVMVPWVTKGKPSDAMRGTGDESRKKIGSQRQEKKHAPRDVGRKTGREDSRPDSEDMKSSVPPSANRTEEGSSITVTQELGAPGGGTSPDDREKDTEITKTFQRYYHLYRSGELERDVIEAGGRVVDSGYEKDNWWAIAMCDLSK
jgi:tRNA (uracil-5-)-methyltransferase TRM9